MTANVYGVSTAVRIITTATVTANPQDVLECNATTQAITVTPPTNTAGTRFTVKKTDSSANAVTISGTVDGTANPTLAYQWQSIELIGDGTNWYRTVRPATSALVDYPSTTDGRYLQKTGGSVSGNLTVGSSGTLGDNGVGEVALTNASTVPTIAPTGGVVAYAQSGVLKWMAPGGAVYDLSTLQALNLDNTNSPNDQGFIAWTADAATTNTAANPASGGVRLGRIILRRSATISYIWLCIVTAGASLTANESFVGLYSSSGTQLGVSADQSSVWTTAGIYKTALTSPYSASAGTYYVAILSNGTTIPAFTATTGGAQSAANANLTVSTGRALSGPGSQASLPASITMSSNSLNSTAYWFAVS